MCSVLCAQPFTSKFQINISNNFSITYITVIKASEQEEIAYYVTYMQHVVEWFTSYASSRKELVYTFTNIWVKFIYFWICTYFFVYLPVMNNILNSLQTFDDKSSVYCIVIYSCNSDRKLIILHKIETFRKKSLISQEHNKL